MKTTHLLRLLTLGAAALGSSAFLTAAPSTSDQPSDQAPAAPINPGANPTNPGATGLQRLNDPAPASSQPQTPDYSDLAPGTVVPAPREDIRATEQAQAASQQATPAGQQPQAQPESNQ